MLNKLAMGRHVARPFQRFPLFSRSLNVAHVTRIVSPYLRVASSSRSSFDTWPISEWIARMETHRSKRFASGVAAIAGRKRARYRHSAYCAAVENVGLRSYTMSGRLMRLRGNGTRRTEQEEKREGEREKEGQHGARCIGRRTNLCRCHANVIRIRSLSTRVHAGFDLSSKRIRQRIPLSIERFLSNFYTQ